MNGKVEQVLDEINEWRHGKLWGATEIAASAGVSTDTVVRWASLADCPISKPAGRYFVTRGALMDWMRQKKCA